CSGGRLPPRSDREAVSRTLVDTHQLCSGEHVALDRVLELLPVRPRVQVERGVEGEELVDVAMRTGSRRRTWTLVPGIAEVIGALTRRRSVLAQRAGLGMDVPRHPVGELTAGGVGIVEDQGQGPGPLGNGAPGERR